MSSSLIVPDASVVIKQIKDEDDSDQALALLKAITLGEVKAAAPELLRYEMLGAALHIGMPLPECGQLLEELSQFGLSLIAPDAQILELAERIATHQPASGGHPSLSDSIYHAMAITLNGIFVTADRRHIEKAKDFGNVMLLDEWQATWAG